VEASHFAVLFPRAGQKRYWLSVAGQTRGPFLVDQVRAALAGRQIGLDTLACPEGETKWQALSEFVEFRRSALSAGVSSQARLLAGNLDAEEAELYLAGKGGDALARLISTLMVLKKNYSDHAALAESLEKSIQVLKARRDQGQAR
jgi:hypothetical protein